MPRSERPISLSKTLPKGDANGLDTIYHLAKDHGVVYAVVRFHADKVTVYPDGTREPVLTIERIEGLPPLTEAEMVPDDERRYSLAKQGERLLLEARRRRTGGDEPDLFDGGVFESETADQGD